MKNKDSLMKIFIFEYFECSGAEEFLEEMALKGWLLDEVKGPRFYFNAMEPKKVRYSVEIFDKASMYDTTQNEENLTYIEYCEKAGWKYLTSSGKLQFFYTENEDTVDIETDPELELKLVHKSVLVKNLYVWFILPIMAIWTLYTMSDNFAFFVTSYMSFFAISMWGFLLCSSLYKSINYFGWYIFSKKRVKRGNHFLYRSRKSIRIYNWFSIVWIVFVMGIVGVLSVVGGNDFSLGMLVMIVAIIGFSLLFSNILKKKKLSRKSNVIITVLASVVVGVVIINIFAMGFIAKLAFDKNSEVITYMVDGEESTTHIYHDEVPVTMEDLGLKSYGHRTSEVHISKTFLASEVRCSDSCINLSDEYYGVSYSVFSSPYKWIMNKYMDSEYYDSPYIVKLKEIDEPAWDANAVYEREYEYVEEGEYTYVIVYDNEVIEFSMEGELSTEDIAVIRKKLQI